MPSAQPAKAKPRPTCASTTPARPRQPTPKNSRGSSAPEGVRRIRRITIRRCRTAPPTSVFPALSSFPLARESTAAGTPLLQAEAIYRITYLTHQARLSMRPSQEEPGWIQARFPGALRSCRASRGSGGFVTTTWRPRTGVPLRSRRPRSTSSRYTRDAVLILEVVGVLPHIQAQDRGLAFHWRTILIGGGLYGKRTVRCGDQPRPARANERTLRPLQGP